MRPIPLRGTGRLEYISEFGECCVDGLVIAVAIGAFHEHDVGFAQPRGRVHEWRVPVSQVTTEDQRAALPLVVVLELHDGRTEDVTRVEQGQCEAGRDRRRRFVFEAAEQVDAGLGILPRIEWLDVRLALAGALAIFPLGLFLVQVARVRQHDVTQGFAGSVRIDGP